MTRALLMVTALVSMAGCATTYRSLGTIDLVEPVKRSKSEEQEARYDLDGHGIDELRPDQGILIEEVEFDLVRS